MGMLDGQAVAFFKSLERPIAPTFLPDMQPIYLYPTRKQAAEMNNYRLKSLDGPKFEFLALDDPANGPNKKSLSSEFPVEPTIHLKIGAQVMLLQNIGDGLANGSTGSVVGFFKSGQADRHHTGRKVGYLRNIQVDTANTPLDCFYSCRADLRDLRDLYPLVKFTTNDGPEWVLVMPNEFSFKIKDKVVAKRFQVHLVLPCWFLINTIFEFSCHYALRGH